MLKHATVSNHPAYTETEAARGVDGRDSRIIYFWQNGVRCSLPYHPVMEAIEPEFDQNIVQSHRHHTGPTGMQYIERLIPDDHVAAGANPYYQLIQRVLGEKNMYKPSTIFDRLANDYKVLPSTRMAYNMMLYLIDEMHSFGYVFREIEITGGLIFGRHIVRYKTGIAIRTEDYIYPLKPGFDPIMWHMADFITKFGQDGCEKKHIRQEFMQNRYWLRTDTWINTYLQAMKEMGYIIEHPYGIFKLVNPVQPFKR